ncbi:CU044_2847 family protein [Streptomyces sp. YIM S03343]
MAIVTHSAADDRGTPVYIEVDTAQSSDGLDEIYGGVGTRGNPAARVVGMTRDVYEDGLRLARTLAAQAAGRLGDLGDLGEGLTPDEIELQLAIRLDAELGAVLVKSSAEAQLQITFRWAPGSAS